MHGDAVAEMMMKMLTLQVRSIVLFRSALAQSLGPASDLGAPVQLEQPSVYLAVELLSNKMCHHGQCSNSTS